MDWKKIEHYLMDEKEEKLTEAKAAEIWLDGFLAEHRPVAKGEKIRFKTAYMYDLYNQWIEKYNIDAELTIIQFGLIISGANKRDDLKMKLWLDNKGSGWQILPLN